MPPGLADDPTIERVAALLRPDQRLLFVTGAGLSADSGLPTYRGVGGLYEGERRPGEIPVEEALSGPMMEVRPDVTWAQLRRLERAARGATFNRGHAVIAEMQDHFAAVWVLTQNVDGFHRLAGSRNVIDIHGDLRVLICTRPACRWRVEVEHHDGLAELPRCPSCGSVARPDVVLFGEALPTDKLATLRGELARGFDAVFSVGTSSLFAYIIEPVLAAQEAGVPTVEINPGTTDISGFVDHKITAGAAEALDAIWTRYRAGGPPS